jgi:SAM-dependent methyltransferase
MPREVPPAPHDGGFTTRNGALVIADHPWLDDDLASFYDLMQFDLDVPLYLELAAAQGGRVLEVACGSGRLVLPLARAGHRVVGVDASPAMLALARRKLADDPGLASARLVQADMRDFRLDGGETFDLAILAVKSFAYLLTREDQQRALASIAAHLRPGGLLALDLLHPAPAWLLEPPGSLRQDIVQHLPQAGLTLARTEAVVSTDLAAQIRVIRSAYELIADDGSLTRKRLVEWIYHWTHRFEAEHLLERAGFSIEALYGGYQREPFRSDSRTMLFLARRSG